MSWPIINDQLLPGGKYVYQAEESLPEKFVRLLGNEEGLGGMVPPQAFLHLKECCQVNLMMHSLSLYYNFLSGNCPSHAPLWLKLLRLNKSARILSKEFRQSIDEFLQKFELPQSQELVAHISDPQELYNLGQFDLLNKIELLPLRIETRLQILSKEIDLEDVIETTKSASISYIDQKLLLGFYFARAAQGKKSIDTKLAEELLSVDISKVALNEIHKVIQIMNSLNLIYFFQGDFDRCQNIFNKEDSIIEMISVQDVKDHIKGNLFFHKAMTAKATGDRKSELNFLLEAMKYDYGFYDYYYRVASLYHDDGDILAKKYYEMALANAPWYQELVNDYGILLDDLNLNDEFASIVEISKFLFPEEADRE